MWSGLLVLAMGLAGMALSAHAQPVQQEPLSPAQPADDSTEDQDAVLDRRIAELENQLALGQEQAERARIEAVELGTRLVALEQQIAAAQEFIRQQDLRLVSLRESIAQAAAAAATPSDVTSGKVGGPSQLDAGAGADSGVLDDFLAWASANPVLTLAGLLALIVVAFALQALRHRVGRSRGSAELQTDPEPLRGTREGEAGPEPGTRAQASVEPGTESQGSAEQESEHRERVEQEESQDASEQPPAEEPGRGGSAEGGEELGWVPEEDETAMATKLELAYAYRQMDDREGARKVLQEVIAGGSETQVKEAEKLLKSLDDSS